MEAAGPAAEAGPSRLQQDGDFRSQIRLLRQRLSGEIADEDELLTLLTAPLGLLGVSEEEVLADGAHSASWGMLGLGPADLDRKPGRDHVWIAEIQELLLEKVFPDWHGTLESGYGFEQILQLWFCPNKNTSSSGAIQLASLSSLTSRVNALRARGKLLPQAAITLQALGAFLHHLSLREIFVYISREVPTAQQTLVWDTSCRQLLSLPDRAAGVWGRDLPKELDLYNWQSRLGVELGERLSFSSNADLPAITLSRCVRSRWLRQGPAGTNDGRMLAALLRNVVQRFEAGQLPQETRLIFAAALQKLSPSEQLQLLSSVVAYCDYHAFIKAGFERLIPPDERSRPGAEGSSFMSADAFKRTGAVRQVIAIFDRDAEIGEDEDEGDFVEEDAIAQLLVQRDARHAAAQSRSPAMIRALVMRLRSRCKGEQQLGEVLNAVVASWSAGVSSASTEEQINTTLAVMLLLASLPEQSKVISDLALSPSMLKGVSAHLEHLSPLVRRLGMLVAETVAQKSGRDLSFGKSAWDGCDDGREEARVLRAAMLSLTEIETAHLVGSEELFSILGLDEAQSKGTASHSQQVLPVAKPRGTPQSTRLPRQVPANKSLIETVDGSADHAEEGTDGSIESTNGLPSLFNVGSRPNLNPLLNGIHSESESESSDSDSSNDEDKASKQDQRATEEGRAFGMGMPSSKNKLRPPVYINELAPLLRENTRASVRMGLRTAQALVERKAGWGGEVHDNAINLALALIGLNNNFRIAHFEQRRLGALTSLVTASPERVASCLIEQYFVHQYSVAQRTAMLNALAFGAQQLSSDESKRASLLTDTQRGLETLSRDLAQLAIARARKEGEARVPEIQREQSLLVNGARSKSSKTTISKAQIASARSPYLAVAQTCFIMPLVNRFWAYLQDNSVAKRSKSIGGSGSSILDMPFLVGAFLDTLAVLCYYAQNDPPFRQAIIPEVMELTLTISRPSLAGLAGERTLLSRDDDANTAGGSRSTILGAASSLVLVLLDAAWQLDGGFSLTSRHADLFVEVQHWAAAIFEASDGGSADRSVGAHERAARSSAALLLRLEEMRQRRRGA